MGSRQVVEVPGTGSCVLPHEFAVFTGPLGGVEPRDAGGAPSTLHARLAEGAALVLSGDYGRIDGIMRYCQRHERDLVPAEEFARIADRGQRSAAFTAARRRKLHHLLLAGRGDSLVGVSGAPETAGLQGWLEEPTGDAVFLIPVRRLQRILTDMRRAAEGVPVDALGGTITILPHVYVPSDQSVPRMIADCAGIIAAKTVLDMGTGTGVLALIAAKLGAARVVATDSNPNAVENARRNVERFSLGNLIEVAGPGDLFAPVGARTFDVIIFNAPWIQGEPQTLYDTASYDPGFKVIDGFMRSAPAHLAGDGVILLQYSNISQRTGEDSLAHLNGIIAAAGLDIASTRTISRLSRILGARERVHLLELRRP